MKGEKLALINAAVITPGGVLKGMSVVVEGGVITSLNSGEIDTADCRVIDLGGRYLSPGFVDLHTHGRLGADIIDGSRETMSRVAGDLLRYGVTGFLLTTQAMPREQTVSVIKSAVEYIKNPNPDGAKPLGIYLEGPYLASARKGAQLLDGDDRVCMDGLKAMIEAGEGHVRVVAVAPELPGATEAIRFLTERGIVVSAAHTDGGYDTAVKAIDAGVTLTTHTFNAMRPLRHRDPEVVGACLTDERVFCEVISDGIHLHPAIVKLVYLAKGAEGMALISDSVMATGLDDGEYDYAGRKYTVQNGFVRLPDGTLAGSTLSLDAAVRNVMEFTGCDICKAVEMASLTPSRVIGVNDKKGTVEIGKDADIAVLDERLRVSAVILAGRYIEVE